MAKLIKVTNTKTKNDFCLTDCGPSEGCMPDDYRITTEPKDKDTKK